MLAWGSGWARLQVYSIYLYSPCRYNQQLYTKLVDRAYNIGWKVRKVIKGGAAQRRFLQKEWKLELHPSEIINATTEIRCLHRKASVLSDKLKEAFPVQPEHRGRSGTKSFGEYSQSHQRRLKRKRATDRELSMNWLHLEGFTPSKLEVLNNETGEMETICLAADIMGSDAHCATQEG